MFTFKDYFDEQMRDPEFAAAYAKVSAEVDREFAAVTALQDEWPDVVL
jgi:hypothetical protein